MTNFLMPKLTGKATSGVAFSQNKKPYVSYEVLDCSGVRRSGDIYSSDSPVLFPQGYSFTVSYQSFVKCLHEQEVW